MEMTIIKAIDLLAPLNRAGSVDSGVAYMFTNFVNAGKVPDRETSPINTEKRHRNLAICYAKEFLETGTVTND
jgi:hypothetical protein